MLIDKQKSINVSMYPAEYAIDALKLYTRTMQELSSGSAEIITEICCKEVNLVAYEKLKGWRKSYGMFRLREALNELIEIAFF